MKLPPNLGWKTITGALLALLAYLSEPSVLAVLPPRVANAIVAIGVVLAMIGLRHAQAKAITAADAAAAPAAEKGSASPVVLLALAAALAVAIGCGPGARARTLGATLHGLDAASAALVAYDGPHQDELVRTATSQAQGTEALAEYRQRRAFVVQALATAYRALAAAAIDPHHPDLATALAAAADALELVRQFRGGTP